MSDLTDLYQELILDHGRSPRNFRALAGADGRAEGFNPLCGDRVTVYLDLEDGAIREVTFEGAGCAICLASASMMTGHLAGLPVDEARAAFRAFQAMLTGTDGDAAADLGRLATLAGVRRYPMRVKCATLPWHTMMAALEGTGETVTTE